MAKYWLSNNYPCLVKWYDQYHTYHFVAYDNMQFFRIFDRIIELADSQGYYKDLSEDEQYLYARLKEKWQTYSMWKLRWDFIASRAATHKHEKIVIIQLDKID